MARQPARTAEQFFDAPEAANAAPPGGALVKGGALPCLALPPLGLPWLMAFRRFQKKCFDDGAKFPKMCEIVGTATETRLPWHGLKYETQYSFARNG